MDRPLLTVPGSRDSLTRSRAITERACEVIPGGVSSVLRALDPPRVFTRGEGAYLWDADGSRYVDFHGGFGPILLGHGHPAVLEAAASAAARLDFAGAGASEIEVAVATKVIEHVPSAERVLFCNSGTEATYHAIRLARAVTGRRLIVKFQGCYHGWHDSVAANVVSAPDRVGTLDPLSAGMTAEAVQSIVVLPFNDVEAFQSTMARLGDEIAAVILEPVVHTIGCVVATDPFLAALRNGTSAAGALLIFDEIVTGFRHDLGGFQALAGVTPDITTLGKAIANGFPLAIVCGRADLMERFDTNHGGDVMYGGTFNGHPPSLAACLATIEELEADGRALHVRLLAQATRVRDGLQEIVDELGIAAHAVSFGSVFVCYFTRRPVLSYDDALTSDPAMYVGFHREMVRRGMFMFPMNLKRNHLMAAHRDDDIDLMLTAARDALTSLSAGSAGALADA